MFQDQSTEKHKSVSRKTNLNAKLRRLLFFFGLWSIILLGFYQTKIVNSIQKYIIENNIMKRFDWNFQFFGQIPVKFDPDFSPMNYNAFQIMQQVPDYSNIPVEYYTNNKRFRKPTKCPVLPYLNMLQFNNVYWQQLLTNNGTFYFYNAYYDKRIAFKEPSIRIVAMIDRFSPRNTTCQLWYENGEKPQLVQAVYIYGWLKAWGNANIGNLQPFIITCVLKSPDYRVPKAVSLVAEKCDVAKNFLKVIDNSHFQENRSRVAVCIKGMSLPDTGMAYRVVEWLEMLKILGSTKVFAYQLNTLHPTITKVLKYYEDMDFLDVRPITLPGFQPNLPYLQHMYMKEKKGQKRLNELVTYNDCLYRNIHKFKYLVIIDIDEVIFPVNHLTWNGLLDDIEKNISSRKSHINSYNTQHVLFSPEFKNPSDNFSNPYPDYMHMLKNIYRMKKFTKKGLNVKCFHEISRILNMHNHFPRTCFKGCRTFTISIYDARLHHYRNSYGVKKDKKYKLTEKGTRDTMVWKYGEDLQHKVDNTLKLLNLFPG